MKKEAETLLTAADYAIERMTNATDPNEINHALRELEQAVKAYRNKNSQVIKGGFMLGLEQSDKRRRITITTSRPEQYHSRSGWKGINANPTIFHSATVSNIDKARELLRKSLNKKHISGRGMRWVDLPAQNLIEIINIVVKTIDNENKVGH